MTDPVPLAADATAFTDRAHLRAEQRRVLRHLDRTTWGWRRVLPMLGWLAALWLVALVTGLALSDGGRESPLLVPFLLVACAVVGWFGIRAVARGLAATRREAAAIERWRHLDRSVDARRLPTGAFAEDADPTGWDRRDEPDLARVAAAVEAHELAQVTGFAARAPQLFVVPWVLGLVGFFALVVPSMTTTQRVGGALTLLLLGVPATIAWSSYFREVLRRQRGANARVVERVALLARQRVLGAPEPLPVRSDVLTRVVTLLAMLGFAGVLAAVNADREAALVAAATLVAAALATAAGVAWAYRPRVRAWCTGPADAGLGVGAHHRVRIERGDGVLRLQPVDERLPPVDLPLSTVRGIETLRLPVFPWLPAAVIVTDDGSADGIWVLTGPGAVAAVADAERARR